MSRSVLLLSAGLDSTVCFLSAVADGSAVSAITFNYGQRAALREVEKAAALCRRFSISHTVVDLHWFAQFTRTALVDRSQSVPLGGAVSIDDPDISRETARSVWVPNRNGIFLSIAAAYAEALGADRIVPGFNREEASTFPDNSEEYMAAFTSGLRFSTSNHVQVFSYTSALDKTEILRLGLKLGLKTDWLWTCYLGNEKPCGECESCLRFLRAQQAVRGAKRV